MKGAGEDVPETGGACTSCLAVENKSFPRVPNIDRRLKSSSSRALAFLRCRRMTKIAMAAMMNGANRHGSTIAARFTFPPGFAWACTELEVGSVAWLKEVVGGVGVGVGVVVVVVVVVVVLVVVSVVVVDSVVVVSVVDVEDSVSDDGSGRVGGRPPPPGSCGSLGSSAPGSPGLLWPAPMMYYKKRAG